ncbi:hypothetical protein [Demequina oxidasica]|uniref:hypothetical protein n=1 Tax=Demequina oxidasica TaxID=676199 RepID=UPI000784E6DB|nr:hypothetical protein [Demequina oxidasica]
MDDSRHLPSPLALAPTSPRLRDGLAVFALDGNRVRVGLSEPVVLDGLTSEEAKFVAQLEGTLSRKVADTTAYPHVVDRLTRLGLMQTRPPRKVTPRGDSHSSVCVMSADALGAHIGLCLAQAGVNRIIFDDDAPLPAHDLQSLTLSRSRGEAAVRAVNAWVPHSACLAPHPGDATAGDVVVVVAYGAPTVSLVHDLMATDRPHLPVMTDEYGVTVGPLVVPGQGPCVTCLGIARTEQDPDWPMVALQCNGERSPQVSVAGRAIAAGVACDAVMRFLKDGIADPRQWRVDCVERGGRVAAGRVATSLRGGLLLSETVVSAHPDCRCHDSSVLSHDLENQESILF